jgi:hypothetical protein
MKWLTRSGEKATGAGVENGIQYIDYKQKHLKVAETLSARPVWGLTNCPKICSIYARTNSQAIDADITAHHAPEPANRHRRRRSGLHRRGAV